MASDRDGSSLAVTTFNGSTAFAMLNALKDNQLAWTILAGHVGGLSQPHLFVDAEVVVVGLDGSGDLQRSDCHQ